MVLGGGLFLMSEVPLYSPRCGHRCQDLVTGNAIFFIYIYDIYLFVYTYIYVYNIYINIYIFIFKTEFRLKSIQHVVFN